MMKNVLLSLSLVYGLVGCVSKTVEVNSGPRIPAGVGDVGSSTDGAQDFMGRYRLPLERDGVEKIRVAYTYWSGEWPSPVIDVKSKQKNGTTIILGYLSPRTLKERKTCTIKNGIYHPWSKNSPSLINYYSFVSPVDFEALKDTVLGEGTVDGVPTGVKVPKGSKVVNVIPLSEGYVSGAVKIGQNLRPVEVFYTDLYESKNFVRITPEDDFREQWLHFQCSEKDAAGKSRTVFVRDQDLLSQPGIAQGTFDDYGKVKAQ
ncbi:hypothetical protein [Bdellovibrio sp. HCB209]|uniref:hypothetical protein n=1 Tax=Bdellovibrio sp. HCB209 TaxID=3394354 RepID=UPI0039B5330E